MIQASRSAVAFRTRRARGASELGEAAAEASVWTAGHVKRETATTDVDVGASVITGGERRVAIGTRRTQRPASSSFDAALAHVPLKHGGAGATAKRKRRSDHGRSALVARNRRICAVVVAVGVPREANGTPFAS